MMSSRRKDTWFDELKTIDSMNWKREWRDVTHHHHEHKAGTIIKERPVKQDRFCIVETMLNDSDININFSIMVFSMRIFSVLAFVFDFVLSILSNHYSFVALILGIDWIDFMLNQLIEGLILLTNENAFFLFMCHACDFNPSNIH